jgi:hypothetical protein
MERPLRKEWLRSRRFCNVFVRFSILEKWIKCTAVVISPNQRSFDRCLTDNMINRKGYVIICSDLVIMPAGAPRPLNRRIY